MATVVEQVKQLRERNEQLENELKELKKPLYKNGQGTNPSELFGSTGPNIRRGESTMTSRGFSYLKLFGAMQGELTWENCRVEQNWHNVLHKCYKQHGMMEGTPNSIMAPFASNLFCDLMQEEKGIADEMRAVIKAGTTGADPMEVMHYRQKFWMQTKTPLSWQDETLGAALVAPPMMGELIEILRNQAALLNAGARELPMPPMGRIVFPRQTGVATAFFIPENTAITESNQTTGDVVLQAKKLGVLVKIPNELFRFSSVAIEQFVREDIAFVMALALDKACLESVGSTTVPKGLINYSNINTLAASKTGSNGDTVQPQDPELLIGTVEEVNQRNFSAYIMRPKLYRALSTRRADAVTTGDAAGPFVFSIVRGPEWTGVTGAPNLAGAGPNLSGKKVVLSTQVSNTRVKGGGSNLTYILGGNFEDYLIAMGGVIEFLVATQGDTALAQDQTWIRGIQYVDAAPRHEASFVLMDTLING